LKNSTGFADLWKHLNPEKKRGSEENLIVGDPLPEKMSKHSLILSIVNEGGKTCVTPNKLERFG
jgi:hypothetical protein